ncbi:hypothetical protein SUNI508_13642 [Seiridium unicorne]|uniref:Uncharacterized protein n=1 Tax=Seiridium unicorne TaxID=138068 RepID=A0ABR2VBX7_9PEZI
MSYQQELRALERNCHAILSREPLTRADLYKALDFADQAYDMAERNGFDQYKLEFYENLQNQCVDRLKTQFSQDTQCERERLR